MTIFLYLLAFLVCCVPWIYVFLAMLAEPLQQKKYARDLSNKVKELAQDKDLMWHILHEQKILKINDAYRLHASIDEEKQFVNEILETHKKSVIDSFFSDSLKKEKKFYILTFQEYYMYSLYCFLNNNLLDGINGKRILSKDLYKYINSDDEWHKNYALTNYAIIYHKLYIIVCTYCKDNKHLSELADFEHSINCSQDNINEEMIGVWHYRP